MLGSPYYFTSCYSLCVVKERVRLDFARHYAEPVEALCGFINRTKLYIKFLALSALFGGDNRDRTGNLQLAKLALSQLSYVPGIS